jgi:hypothetical protein
LDEEQIETDGVLIVSEQRVQRRRLGPIGDPQLVRR